MNDSPSGLLGTSRHPWLVLAATGILAGLAVSLAYAQSAEDKPKSGEKTASDESGDAPRRREEELLRKKRRFDRLPETEQQRLRDFHRELSAEPNGGQELIQVMKAYEDWLRNLRPGERAELLSLPADERIVRIRKVMQDKANERLQRYARSSLTGNDADRVAEWMRDVISKREDGLIERMNSNEQRAVGRESGYRKGNLLRMKWLQLPITELALTSEEIDALEARLSDVAVQALNDQPDTTKRYQLIRELINAATVSRMRGERGGFIVDEGELWKFYSNLDSETRDYLESLPSAQMRGELHRQYFLRRYGSRFSRGPRGGGSSRASGPPRGEGQGDKGQGDAEPKTEPKTEPPTDTQ
jgi:hypothetical protein